ncbi:MAG TPA: AI-2E family transporter, partial [Candidatus Limnocylindrales bacterium]|nr:AI-2E family transporter [Candidatus Limnocylindrales bacterium]
LSGAVAVLVALVDEGPLTALLVLAAVILVQQVESHILQPLIMGRAVSIHPLVVIVAIAAGIVLAGIVGALIAVPIVAMLNTAIRHLGQQPKPATAATRLGDHQRRARPLTRTAVDVSLAIAVQSRSVVWTRHGRLLRTLAAPSRPVSLD